MASPAYHQQIRDIALGLARAQLIIEFGQIIKPEGTAELVEFDNIHSIHCQEVWDTWRKATPRELINLNWHRQMSKKRDQIDVSIHCHNRLCGLMLARYSRRRINVNLRFLEGCPSAQTNSLLGYIMPIGLLVAEQFAIAYGAQMVTISNPDKVLIPRYRSHGYDLVSDDKDRERRKCAIRGKLLVKKLS